MAKFYINQYDFNETGAKTVAKEKKERIGQLFI